MQPNDLLPDQIAEIEEEADPLLRTSAEFEEGAARLDLEPWIVQRLRHPERELTANLAFTRDNGETLPVTGVRVQHHTGGLPSMGPVRWSHDCHLHAVRAAAMFQTWQLALLDLPFGGAAGAVLCNPDELSERELRTVARAYAHGLRGLLGSTSDVPTPGAGCNPQTIAWMLEGTRSSDLGAVTGKPEELWGVPGSSHALAYGITALLAYLRPPLHEQRVAVQAIHPAPMAMVLHEAEAHVVAAADHSGGVMNDNRLDVPALAAHVQHKGVVFGFAGGEAVCNADVLEAECDALVLAGAERQITSVNAGRVRASVVFEVTPGAMTRAAETALLERGVIVVPPLIATAGSSIAAYLEWAHNTRCSLEIPNLPKVIAERVCGVYDAAHSAAQTHQGTLREAALVIAVQRVAKRMRVLGNDN
ncbi:MAG: Glu/Leu/Phe/Val dehydrogenase [Terriglobales bacterium]